MPSDAEGGEPGLSSSRDLSRLVEILAALRAPETGCPWDSRQTHATLAPYAIEEAYELTDAIERGDVADMRDELGDCLLQVVFHARVAEEAGAFDLGDVIAAVVAKMLRRHPQVFSPACATGAAEPPGEGDDAARSKAGAGAPAGWEAIKAEERRRKRRDGLLADVPIALPGLVRAVKLQSRAATVGFDWDDIRLVVAKIREEIAEVEAEIGGPPEALRDEIGDLLFAVGNLARHAAIDPEAALRSANAKFERRFASIERALAASGSSPREASSAEMEALWLEAKREERRQIAPAAARDAAGP